MKEIKFPYGKTQMSYSFDESELLGVLTSSIEEYVPEKGQEELVIDAMENPLEQKNFPSFQKVKIRLS